MTKLSDVVKALCIDKYFGVYTRNYIDYILTTEYKGVDYTTVIVDFDGVKKLNTAYGYKAVNDIFREMFLYFAPQYKVTVGRWFSGDEIILIADTNAEILIDDFRAHCAKYNLSFKVILSTTEPIDKIEVW